MTERGSASLHDADGVLEIVPTDTFWLKDKVTSQQIELLGSLSLEKLS